MAMPYFKIPILTLLVLFFFFLTLEEKIVKVGFAIFDKTCHGLKLEGVIILCVMWLCVM